MALTVAEAIAVNTLLRYFLNSPRPGAGIPDEGKALQAAALLANHAATRLGVGPDGDDVVRAWPRRRGGRHA